MAPAFIIIGENIHASRAVRRAGSQVTTTGAGQPALRFTDRSGAPRTLEIPDALPRSAGGSGGLVKQVQAAILAGRSGSAEARSDGIAYLQSLASRQVDAGAAWLDLNVDEISPDEAFRQDAMRWLVGVVEEVTAVPVAIDSSSPAVLAAGLAAVRTPGSRTLLNSASLERPEALDLALAHGGPVVVSAAGAQGLPAGVEEQVANALRMAELALQRGIRAAELFVDPLVLPAAVRPDGASGFLATVRELRRRLGPEVHITGGLSNVSYGLPARRLLHDVFLSLVIEAGADSGILDPLQTVPGRPATAPGSRPWQLATGVLLGEDPHGRMFVRAHRAGELEPSEPRNEERGKEE